MIEKLENVKTHNGELTGERFPNNAEITEKINEIIEHLNNNESTTQ